LFWKNYLNITNIDDWILSVRELQPYSYDKLLSHSYYKSTNRGNYNNVCTDPNFYKLHYPQQPGLGFYQTISILNYLEKKPSILMKQRILANFKHNLLVCISKRILLSSPFRYPKDVWPLNLCSITRTISLNLRVKFDHFYAILILQLLLQKFFISDESKGMLKNSKDKPFFFIGRTPSIKSLF
jgi:hypothetical protein